MADDFDDVEDIRVASPLDYVSPDQIQDLWGIGYTIVPRSKHPDPFHVPDDMIPKGRSYQWMHLVHDKVHFHWAEVANPPGWAPVPASRYPGYFMPFGAKGQIEVSGCGLFEKPTFEVEQDRAQQVAAAHKLVNDWKTKWGGQFSGEMTVGTQTESGYSQETTKIGATKTVEDTTKIPRDMVPYIARIFEERDRISTACLDETNCLFFPEQYVDIGREFSARMALVPDAPKWPTLNAAILPYAIKNIRKRIAEEAASAQAS